MNRLKNLAELLLLMLVCAVAGRAQDLKLLISVQQQNIVEPNPVRATLHLHNSGQQTLWLYRPIRGNVPVGPNETLPPATNQSGPGQPYGGSGVGVQLEAIGSSESSKTGAAGNGFAIGPDALPSPRLVRLAPGDDYEERVSIHLEPARTKAGGSSEAVWGHYKFSVVYSADYSNAGALARDINADLWHGRVSSNSVTLDLQPPRGQGSIAGTVLDAAGRPYAGALVTLSDENENPLDQLYSDENGEFSFTHLPFGRYWITVREPGSAHDTSVFRIVDVKQAGSPATAQIMMLPVEADKADRILHKPVLFHIVNDKGQPLANVKLIVLKSNGNIVENLKGETGQDGFAAISLIPGSIYITLRRAGCKDEDRPADVAYGPGVDGFKFAFSCTRK